MSIVGFNPVLRAVQAQPRLLKVHEKAGTLRISAQDPAEAVQVVKNPALCAGQAVHAAKEAMEGVVGSPLPA